MLSTLLNGKFWTVELEKDNIAMIKFYGLYHIVEVDIKNCRFKTIVPTEIDNFGCRNSTWCMSGIRYVSTGYDYDTAISIWNKNFK